jgi:hypothetical protein
VGEKDKGHGERNEITRATTIGGFWRAVSHRQEGLLLKGNGGIVAGGYFFAPAEIKRR